MGCRSEQRLETKDGVRGADRRNEPVWTRSPLSYHRLAEMPWEAQLTSGGTPLILSLSTGLPPRRILVAGGGAVDDEAGASTRDTFARAQETIAERRSGRFFTPVGTALRDSWLEISNPGSRNLPPASFPVPSAWANLATRDRHNRLVPSTSGPREPAGWLRPECQSLYSLTVKYLIARV